MNNIIVTTSVKTSSETDEKAKEIARKLNLKFYKRNKKTVNQLLNINKGVIVVYKNKISYYQEEAELFFHLDTTALKIKNNDNEPLIEIIGSNTQSILDCTMGLASDSIILSYYNHDVTALEKNKIIHLIVNDGLKNYQTNDEKINEAMQKIKTYNVNALEYLKNCEDNKFDIIYFDPMFSHNIKESTNLAGIEKLADYNFQVDKFLKEAHRVAKNKIIVKAHYRDKIFEKYNFTRIIRKNTKFHYGYINIKTKN